MEPEKQRIVLPPSQELLKEALHAEDVPKIYANGFHLAHTHADVSIFLQQHGKVVAIVSMSFTLAKTLAQLVGNQILELENELDHQFLTTRRFEEKSE